MRKRILSLLLAMVIVVSLATPAVMASGTANLSIRVDKTAVREGGTFTVTINNSEMTVSSFTGGITFDNTKLECVSIVGVVEDDLNKIYLVNSNDEPKEALAVSTPAEANGNGYVGFAWVGTEEVSYKSGTIAVITFSVKTTDNEVVAITLYEDSDGTDGELIPPGSSGAQSVNITLNPPIEDLSGTVTISGVEKFGEELSASVTSNNTGTLQYQWKRGDVVIEDATNSTYTLAAEDIGSIVTCVVTSTVETGSISQSTGVIAKADGPAAPDSLIPVKPTTKGGSDGKITGTDITMEYSTNADFSGAIDCTGDITNLTAGTYYVRVKATDTHKAGAHATVVVPEGDPAVVNGISVNSSTHKVAYKVGEALDVTDLTILVDMSYGDDPTVNVTPEMVTGFNSSAVAASQTLTITYEGKTTTYVISIAKADGPAAPDGLTPVKPTTKGGTDGKITGTDNTMEYSTTADFSGAIDCTGDITNLTAGTYYVRVKATDTHEAGAHAEVIVPDGDPAVVKGISVNSSTHKVAYKVGEALDVTDLTILVDMSYGDDSTVNVTSEMVTGFDSSAVAAAQTLTITYEGKTTTYVISIAKADGPAAPDSLTPVRPTTKGGSDGKITGTDNTMEYSTTADFDTAIDCTGDITDLTAGTYYVRVKATDTHEAGAYAEVVVEDGILLGDVNQDGVVTAADLTVLARHIADIEELTDDDAILSADVTGDGDVTSADLTKLARYVARIITDL